MIKVETMTENETKLGSQLDNLIDCVYFLNGQCGKGTVCPFRHHEQVLSNFNICKFWINGQCNNLNCNFRHPKIKPKVELFKIYI